ncbi:hypothetical protein RJ640_028799 [Escallonia rubra]|uniref:Argonaute 5 n=1 Tax=Escallonia rubra TaxID=112253 RepID=A0AA88UD79_9ASTE|nr:hypothetical protein RJ640_028799 [Escallonia rubra]
MSARGRGGPAAAPGAGRTEPRRDKPVPPPPYGVGGNNNNGAPTAFPPLAPMPTRPPFSAPPAPAPAPPPTHPPASAALARDVSITPEVVSKKVCREIMIKLVASYRESCLGKRELAYDGKKSAYTAGPLPFNSKEFVVQLVEKDGARKERDFKVTIKFAAKPDLHHLQQFLRSRQLDAPYQETIQVLDVVLRATPSISYEAVGSSFFAPVFGSGELADGLQYWKGFYQSIRPTQMGLSLNVDMSARAFYEPILVSEFVSKYFSKDLSRPLSDQDRVKIKKALKGVRVELDHMEYVRRYKITGISNQPTSQIMFSDDTGERVSVVQYFCQKYNINLQYAFLPALQAGTDAKPIYLPMEISRIVQGQRYSKKLNDKQVTALLRATCQRPNQREASIKQMVSHNNYNNDKIVNEEFGLQVKTDLTCIDARVLPPPTLKYHETGREARVDPRVGQWNMINKKMVKAGKVDFWTCINFSKRSRPDLVEQFCYELVTMCSSKGMVINVLPLLPAYSAPSGNVEKALCDIHTQSTAKLASLGQTGRHLELLIIILPDFAGSYGTIKRVCETELGIISQCCQPKHVSRIGKQYLENVALKINVKAGGSNNVLMHAFDRKIPLVSDRPTIIFGADVTHPSPGEDASPSIAAVVASMDWPFITKYRALVSAQAHREEIIQDLYRTNEDSRKGTVHLGMIRDHLIAFRKSTGHKPYRIIFYRDGVSEGQFSQVLLYEMDAIRKACVSLEENYLPPVTFVVVQKRHHTRLFPVDHSDHSSTDKSGNILPGTIVETKICHPTEFDFYLCSHAGIQGTSRPTHYHVLYDENKFTADALQMLTNSLCYTYARCTRSVSIVPPAYYAHLAAFRARYYIEGDASESGSTSGGTRTTRERNVDIRPLPLIKENVKDVMFYC